MDLKWILTSTSITFLWKRTLKQSTTNCETVYRRKKSPGTIERDKNRRQLFQNKIKTVGNPTCDTSHLTPRGNQLTHWDRVTHICIDNITIIGSDNGLSPGRRQAIIWTNAGILLIRPLGTNFKEILIGNQTFSFKKIHLKMSSAKWWPFCLGLNVLNAEAPAFLPGSSSSRSSQQHLGAVSLTFGELSKILSRNLCIAEIVLLMRISSWNFVRVPKAMLWAHAQSLSLKFSP